MILRAIKATIRSTQLQLHRGLISCNVASEMSTVAEDRTNSPPNKRLRHGSSSAIESLVTTNGESSHAPSNGSSAPTFRTLTPKENAKRIKARLRDREKSLAKFGEEPIYFDIRDLLNEEKIQAVHQRGAEAEFEQKFAPGSELECTVERLSAHGDGLAVAPGGDWVIAVPHTMPGERVRVRIRSNERMYSNAVRLSTLEEHQAQQQGSSSLQRRDDLVRCRYYGACSGCQYQHLSYDDQLKIKQSVVQRAFQNYSNLDTSLIPSAHATLPSPLQYEYRTKLTPHFDLPAGMRKRRNGKQKVEQRATAEHVDVPIGFDRIGTKKVMDIEDCVIGTSTINTFLPIERKRIKESLHTYSNGATILLRDSLQSFDGSEAATTVVTDHKATVKECVGQTKFLSPAGAFFQNNRSILPSLLTYVKEEIERHTSASEERFLVDAYCGSGLFSLCLANLFTRVSGVEISADSIKYAKENAVLNKITNVDFLAGDAQEIFKQVSFDSAKTTMILDPPRRGCDEPFIRQLLHLGPQLVVYVSCNVHTQARDVGQIINGLPGAPKRAYRIVSLRGADLFPQTYHVEGICVLELVQ